MKKIYLLAVIFFVFQIFSSCSKDVLRSYERRVIGTWKLHDIDRYGIGRSNNLPFKEDGIFTFADNGELSYAAGGNIFKGSWDVRKENDDDNQVQTLHITVIDFINQQVLTEYFNSMLFKSTNRFNTSIKANNRTYIFRFLRQ